MSTRTQVLGLALGRLALGAALVVVPKKGVGAGWVGREAERPASRVLLRAVGARDVALALGTLVALRTGGPLRSWLLCASIADATDVAATLAAGTAIPMPGRVAVAALGGGALVQQLALVRGLDD